jgi:YfiH family protein
MAKVHVADTLHKAADVAIQLQGARGFSQDSIAQWIYRSARSARLVDGASEVHMMVLLVDERIRAAAAVHAGWRGTAAGIVRDAVAMMREKFGTRAEDLHAAIGPGIGVCCYEVGPEVAGRFGVRRVEGQGRAHLDLPAENRRQLLESGVTGERIYASNLCTMCRSGEFHSFRRDGEAAGRMYSFVGIR